MSVTHSDYINYASHKLSMFVLYVHAGIRFHRIGSAPIVQTIQKRGFLAIWSDH